MFCSNGFDYIISLIVIGDSGIGKSALLRQFSRGDFEYDVKPTVGTEMDLRPVSVLGKSLCLRLTDTAGQERYKSITRQYYRNAAGILLIYDVTARQTFNNLPRWLEDIRQYAGANVSITVVGNKKDLINQRVVSYAEGEAFAREHHLPFVETSAKDAYTVEDAFMNTTVEICKKIELGLLRNKSHGIMIGEPELPPPPPYSSQSCCW
ncbi:ras family-domain-containing protein [Gamsiella multidivaricata]|uniref:ras family-domain-containing protein n=1 Tax=Gamsiella multidivaricata TaxID=101098 RepID=UPI00221FBC3F|nr:ras family-domain-containing protein [Gamsiella multidivaricata]KAI7832724.1 ras family-domain-containing protein [Gamsiella multidivaricata]